MGRQKTSKQPIKLDYRRFCIFGRQHVTESDAFQDASQRVIHLHNLLLEGKDSLLKDKDVVMLLRIQLERQSKVLFPGLREYATFFGLTEDILKSAKKDVIVMHPGPLNRGVEITSEVADGPHSVILDQVANGVAVRMAILYLLIGGS